MASKVTAGADYTYDISLVGKYAYAPLYLQRWSYPASSGNDTTPAGGWVDVIPTVIGSAVQLANEFPYVGLLDARNTRECNQSTYGTRAITFPAGYPCRTQTAGGTWDLLYASTNPIRKYQTTYLSNPIRQPGNLTGLLQSIIVEIPYTAENFSRHNSMFIGSINEGV